MKESKSNTNLIKKTKGKSHSKTNIFKQSYGNHFFNNVKTNNAIRKNFLISLLEKNTIINSNKNNFNKKKNNNKEINLTSGIENLNIVNENKGRFYHGNINIKLNLNNEIINNNFNNYYTTITKNFNKSKSNININDKIKEKDELITKLQKELLQSQKLLNQIQKDKQNELAITYNTIKKYDKLEKNNRSLNALLKSPSILKFNYNKKIKGNINKKYYNIFNSHINLKSKRKYKIATLSPKQSHIRCFSSSPNRFFTYNLDNLESYNSLSLTKNKLYPRSSNITGLGNKSNLNIFLKKNDKFPTEFYFTRQLSYSNYNYDNIKNGMNKNFYDKCQKLKKRAKLLLNNYIVLIKEYSKSNN